jgi:hypothetical protein
MADDRENGTERQDRIQHEQHRPEQNEGYDEAAHGGKGVPSSDVGIPLNPGDSAGGDSFDRAAREAANDVRRQDKSAE